MAIELKEALQILKDGKWHSLRCLTADLVKGTGGKLIQYAQCRIARGSTMIENRTPTVGTTGRVADAEHNRNFTINLELQNKQIRKIHPILITHINNIEIL